MRETKEGGLENKSVDKGRKEEVARCVKRAEKKKNKG